MYKAFIAAAWLAFGLWGFIRIIRKCYAPTPEAAAAADPPLPLLDILGMIALGPVAFFLSTDLWMDYVRKQNGRDSRTNSR